MAKTANSWQINQSEMTVEVSAADAAALGAPLTITDSIIIDGVLRSFKRTTDPERAVTSTRVTGDLTPILSTQDTIDHEIWELMMVDDAGAGGTGEWGVDTVTAVELFELYYNARRAITLTATPAGGATGDTQYTLTDAEIIMLGVPEMDADSSALAMRTVRFAVATHTTAAHA
jgi:hypothetical protein